MKTQQHNLILQSELGTERMQQNVTETGFPMIPIIGKNSPLLKRKIHSTVQGSTGNAYNVLSTDHDENSSIPYDQLSSGDRGALVRRRCGKSIQLNPLDDVMRQQVLINHPSNLVCLDTEPTPTPTPTPIPIDGFKNKVWQKHSLNILILVLRFISHITKANFATSFKLVTKNVFTLIDDTSSDFDHYRFNDFFKYKKPSLIQTQSYYFYITLIIPLTNTNIYKKIKETLQLYTFLLKPEQTIMIIWNVYIIIVLTISMYYTTLRLMIFQKYRLAFPINSQRHDYNMKEVLFDLIPNCSFIFEILLKLNTCYYERGHLIQDRVKIVRYYFNTNFLLDFIVVLPFFVTFIFNQSYFDLLVILKVLQVTKLTDSLFSRLELSRNQIAVFDLFQLIYMIMLVAHFCACLWYMVGSLDNRVSWVITQKIELEDWVVLYSYSIYWSIITMTTIGYGDITPINVQEKIFVTGITLVSCGMFAYSINKIGTIFGELAKKSNQYRSDMNSLKKYLRNKGIHQDLHEKVRRYFEYIWSEDSEIHDDAFKFEEIIPEQLRDVYNFQYDQEMKRDTNIQIIGNIGFLKDNFSDEFLNCLCKYFKPKRVGPEEIIYSKNSDSSDLYVLNHGEVHIFLSPDNNKQSLKNLQEIEIKNNPIIFGHLDFFQNRAHQSSAKSTKVSDVLVVSRVDILTVLKAYPNDFQRYCEMKDLVQFGNKFDEIGVCCRACNKGNHVIQQCPMIMGTPNRSKVIYNYLKQVPSDRKKYTRKNDLRRICTLAEQASLQESVIMFLLSNDEYSHHLLEIKAQMQENLKIQTMHDIIIKQVPSPLLLANRRGSSRILTSQSKQHPSTKSTFWQQITSNQHSTQLLHPIEKPNFKNYKSQGSYMTPKAISSFLPLIKEEPQIQNPESNPSYNNVVKIFTDNNQEHLKSASQNSLTISRFSKSFLKKEENIPLISALESEASIENSPEAIQVVKKGQKTIFQNRKGNSGLLNDLKTGDIKHEKKKSSSDVSVVSEDQDEDKPTKSFSEDIDNDFDAIHSYPNYFKQNNIENVLKINSKLKNKDNKTRFFKVRRQITIINLLSQNRSRMKKVITSKG